MTWRTGAKFQALLNLANLLPNFSIANYVKFLVFNFLERVNKGELKVSKYQLLKPDRSCYTIIS